MHDTQKEMRKNMVSNNIDAIHEVKAQRDNTKKIQKEHDKKYGFNHFPFTHGEELEKARAEHKDAYINEMRAMRALKDATEDYERGDIVGDY